MLLAEYFLLNSFLAQFFIAQSTDCKSSCNSLSFNLINPFGVSVHRSRSTTFKGSTKNDPVSVFSLLYIKDFSPPHRRRWANMRANMNPCKLTKTKKKDPNSTWDGAQFSLGCAKLLSSRRRRKTRRRNGFAKCCEHWISEREKKNSTTMTKKKNYASLIGARIKLLEKRKQKKRRFESIPLTKSSFNYY